MIRHLDLGFLYCVNKMIQKKFSTDINMLTKLCLF